MRFWHIFTILMADIIFVFITPVCSNTSEFWSMVYFFNKGNRRHSIPWVTHLPRNRGCTLLLMGDNMLVWQSDRLWLSLDFLAAGDVKSISANLFCVFPVLCKDGATHYAFVSVTVIDSLLLTVNSNQNKIEAIWVQTSVNQPCRYSELRQLYQLLL